MQTRPLLAWTWVTLLLALTRLACSPRRPIHSPDAPHGPKPNPTPGGRDHFVFLTGDRGACHLDRRLQVGRGGRVGWRRRWGGAGEGGVCVQLSAGPQLDGFRPVTGVGLA